jgi:hypothetical protein
MRSQAKQVLILALMLAGFDVACYGATGLIGTWRTETAHVRQPGNTNTAEAFQMIKFLEDGSVNISDVVTLNGVHRTNVSFTGTFTMTARNRASLKLLSHDVAIPAHQRPLTVSCSISGDELSIPKLDASVVPEDKKYRRVK